MDSFKRTWSHGTIMPHLLLFRESQYTPIRDVAAFHKPDALEFGQRCQLMDRVVRQVGATSKVNVPDPIAEFDKLRHASVSYTRAVAEMNVVQVFAQPRDCQDGAVSQVTALGKDEIA